MVVITRGGDYGSSSVSGSGSCAEPIDERQQELIAVEITRKILDATPVMFGTIKEGIMKLM